MKRFRNGIAALLAAAAIVTGISACGSSGGSVARADTAPQTQAVFRDDSTGGAAPAQTTTARDGRVTASIKVELEDNLFMAKYNVDVYIGGEKADTIGNGDSKTYTFKNNPGTYVVRAEKNGNSSVNGEATFHLDSDGQDITVSMKAHTDYIEVHVSD